MGTCAFDKLFTKNVPDILEKIFFSSDYGSFKNCLKVNTTWNKLLTSESYKKKAKTVYKYGICRDNRGLWHAAASGSASDVRRLLSSGMLDVNYFLKSPYTNSTITPLHQASWEGHKDVVKLLLARGAEVNQTDERKRTPLHMASTRGHKWVVKVLLDKGADANLIDECGQTALHEASYRGHKNVVKNLIERGIAINTKINDATGLTALHMASSRGHKCVVRLLLDGGANPNLIDNSGQTAMQEAEWEGHTEVVQIFLARKALY